MKMNINSERRVYQSPQFTVVSIDKDISLVMMTGNDPSDPPANPSFINHQNDNEKQDPFKSPFE